MKKGNWNQSGKWDASKTIKLELTLEQCQKIKELLLNEVGKDGIVKILVALDTQIDKQMGW